MSALLPGVFGSLDDLFEDYQFIDAVPVSRGGNRYPHEPGWYQLTGLPGTLTPGAALFAKPRDFVVKAAAGRMTNHAIGSFRSVQSAYWLKSGLLPVFVIDTHHIASPLLAFVPHKSEHERWNHG